MSCCAPCLCAKSYGQIRSCERNHKQYPMPRGATPSYAKATLSLATSCPLQGKQTSSNVVFLFLGDQVGFFFDFDSVDFGLGV